MQQSSTPGIFRKTGFRLFPDERFDGDFPLVYWGVGLWLYLKSFLYLCYLYSLGLEPRPYDTGMLIEIGYFALTVIPSFILGWGLWNRKRGFAFLAMIFLLIDTPLFIFHIIRWSDIGYLEAGLTLVMEYGSLGINLLCIGWLGSYLATEKMKDFRGY